MPERTQAGKSKSATPQGRGHLVVYGDLTASEFLELWTACIDIGPADAAYLLGYPAWVAGPNTYVFTGEGPDA